MTQSIKNDKPSVEEAEAAVRTLLAFTGEDTTRNGLKDTPSRVVRAFLEYFKGYNEDPKSILKTTFAEIDGYDDIVLLKDIPFYSHCEHHMAPIVGFAHIAYIPAGRVVGISKLARIVETFARRLQIQEKMTAQIATAIDTHLSPKGVAVMICATHHCMLGRGVNKIGAELVTTHYTGMFKTNSEKRTEVHTLFTK